MYAVLFTHGVNENIYSTSFYTSGIIIQLIPHAPLKTVSKALGFSLMKFCKCQNLNFLFCEISFLELPKYVWNLQMLSIIEKFKNWKIFWKIGTPFGRGSWKIGLPLACWHIKLNNWHTFGTIAHLLSRWHIKKFANVFKYTFFTEHLWWLLLLSQ